jgi:hypothetical protein
MILAWLQASEEAGGGDCSGEEGGAGQLGAGSRHSSGSSVSEASSVFVTVGLPVLGCRQETEGDMEGLPAAALFGHQALFKCSTL